MSASYVDFRGREFATSDAALEIWLALLVREIDRSSSVPTWLKEARDDWDLQARSGFGYGIVPELDRHLVDDARRDALLGPARSALVRLESFGPVIPVQELNALGTGGEGVEFEQDLPADSFLAAGRNFIALLEGQPVS